MRFRHGDGTLVHLAYCTNVHPAEDLDGVLGQLARYAGPVRERLGVARLGVGLWLARGVASALVADPAALARLRVALDELGLEVVTINGFPYGGFHAEVVKKAVYRPDWTERERLDYTVDLARILARLLPDDAARGSISTLPLAWREAWTTERAAAAAANLDELARALAAIEAETGRTIRVALEPEPGCVVERIGEAARELAGVDRERIGVCVDACHLAVGFETPEVALATLDAAGLAVVKVQAACAIEAAAPSAVATRDALAAFVEPRFLHQARRRPAAVGASPAGVDDLDEALAGGLDDRAPWRAHVHVPLHAELDGRVATTRPVLEDLLGRLFEGPRALTDHVEVETYTWSVLPAVATVRAAARTETGGRGIAVAAPPADGGDATLVEGLAAELDWSRRRLVAAGLEEVP